MVYTEQLLRLIEGTTPELLEIAKQGKDIRIPLEDKLDTLKLNDLELVNMQHEDILHFALKRHNVQLLYDSYMEELVSEMDINICRHGCIN